MVHGPCMLFVNWGCWMTMKMKRPFCSLLYSLFTPFSFGWVRDPFTSLFLYLLFSSTLHYDHHSYSISIVDHLFISSITLHMHTLYITHYTLPPTQVYTWYILYFYSLLHPSLPLSLGLSSFSLVIDYVIIQTTSYTEHVSTRTKATDTTVISTKGIIKIHTHAHYT